MAYKILSFDGGGSWAVLQLLTLLERYGNLKGHQVLQQYDCVVANSGGSIVLTALCENWSIKESIELFKEKALREKIFSKNKFKERFFPVDYLRYFKLNLGPKYSSKRKREAFEELFPNCNKRRLYEIPDFIGNKNLKIIICAYDALNNKAVLFKSYKNEEYFDDVTLVQAIHASSNAPIQYFDFPARFKAKNSEIFYELWDGALGGFNNPAAVGVNEAIQNEISPSEIHLVSLGTGNIVTSMDSKSKYYQAKDKTIQNRHRKLIPRKIKAQLSYFSKSVMQQAKTILYQPPDWSNEIASTMIFGPQKNYDKSRFIRLSPLIYYNSRVPITSKELIEALINLDMDLTTETDINLLFHCFKEWANDSLYNQPITYRIKREGEIIPKTGTLLFSEAMNEWVKEDTRN